MRTSDYFAELERQRCVLERHGFSQCPSDQELLGSLIAMSDRLDAICAYLGIEMRKSLSGNWHVANLGEGGI